MWYLRALAVAAVAVPLMVGSGCVSTHTRDMEVQAERDKTIQSQKDLDQAKKQLKKDQDTIADLTQQAAQATALQQQLDTERKHMTELQASRKVEVENARKAQEHVDAAASSRRLETLTKELAKAHQRNMELTRDLSKLKREEATPPKREPVTRPVTPPVAPPVTPPVTPPATPPASPN